jgi:hypothetical protein
MPGRSEGRGWEEAWPNNGRRWRRRRWGQVRPEAGTRGLSASPRSRGTGGPGPSLPPAPPRRSSTSPHPGLLGANGARRRVRRIAVLHGAPRLRAPGLPRAPESLAARVPESSGRRALRSDSDASIVCSRHNAAPGPREGAPPRPPRLRALHRPRK